MGYNILLKFLTTKCIEVLKLIEQQFLLIDIDQNLHWLWHDEAIILIMFFFFWGGGAILALRGRTPPKFSRFAQKWNRAMRGSKHAPRDVSIHFKSRLLPCAKSSIRPCKKNQIVKNYHTDKIPNKILIFVGCTIFVGYSWGEEVGLTEVRQTWKSGIFLQIFFLLGNGLKWIKKWISRI